MTDLLPVFFRTLSCFGLILGYLKILFQYYIWRLRGSNSLYFRLIEQLVQNITLFHCMNLWVRISPFIINLVLNKVLVIGIVQFITIHNLFRVFQQNGSYISIYNLV